MGLTRDQITSFDTFAPVSSRTESFSPAGTDRLLVVAVEAFRTGSPATTDTVTHNGVAMTKVAAIPVQIWMELSFWYLVNPDTSGDVVVNCTNTNSGDGQIRGTIASYTGAKQTGGYQGYDSQLGGSGSNMFFNLTSGLTGTTGILAMFGSGVSVANANLWLNTNPRPMIFDYDFATTTTSMTVQGNVGDGNGGIMINFGSSGGGGGGGGASQSNFFPFF